MSIIEKAVNKLERKSVDNTTRGDLPAVTDVETSSISHSSHNLIHMTPQEMITLRQHQKQKLREIVNIPFERLRDWG